MSSPINISDIELYEFLGLRRYATEKELKKSLYEIGSQTSSGQKSR